MKKFVVACLAMSLMGSAFAQSSEQASASQPQTTSSSDHKAAAELPGAQSASSQSKGDLVPFYVVAGAGVLGAIIIASSGGGHHSGTTGTH